MEKPRIIIADTDFNYLVPIQLKFAEEFSDKFDIEIISDKTYFEDLFSSPQKAEILIVSEELYDFSLQRHNIKNIFLMMEQYEESDTEELNLHRLFKYTSIKEIFNEIISKSAVNLNNDKVSQKQSKIIMVYSASGGNGKTTLALGISACITKCYKKVLYINADRLQNFQCMLSNSSPISETDVYSKLSKANMQSYSEIKHVIRKELFSYLPPFKAALMSLGISYSIYEILATSVKKSNDYDYIIIDADTAFDEDKANLLNIADKVIIVTEQNKGSLYATNNLIGNISGIDSDKYIFVCNNFDKEKENNIVSQNMTNKFTINEYVERIEDYDSLNCDTLSKDNGIQKTAFLVM